MHTHHAQPHKRPRAFTIVTPLNKHAKPVLHFRGHRDADAFGRHDVRAAVRQWEGTR